MEGGEGSAEVQLQVPVCHIFKALPKVFYIWTYKYIQTLKGYSHKNENIFWSTDNILFQICVKKAHRILSM